MTNKKIKIAQELYDYCKYRHGINPKGSNKVGEPLDCYGCPFIYHNILRDSWECGADYPHVWDIPGRE